MMNESFDIRINPFYFRVIPQSNDLSGEAFCLIHGWSGNEKSMSIFSGGLTKDKISIFPRGSVVLGENSFAWVDINAKRKPNFIDYANISKELHQSILELIKILHPSNTKKKLNLIGFSQGAAICSVLSILFPESVNKVALLAGFLPAYPPNFTDGRLSNTKYYIAHGTQDKLVEFKKALELKEYFEKRVNRIPVIPKTTITIPIGMPPGN
jgi:phospholipase/carboxylesterase